MIANKMQGIHQTRLAKLTKDIPRLEVIPSSASEEDKDLARTGTKMLDWFWQNEKMPQLLIDLSSWMIDCGTAFLMPRWDPDKGPKIPTYKKHDGKITGEEGYKVDTDGYILDGDGEKIIEDVTVGEATVDVIPPFDVINDQVTDDIIKSHWVIVQQAMSLKDIQSRWPEQGKKVKAEKDIATRAYYQRRLLSLVGNQSEFFTPENDYSEEMATVKHYFERKCDQYPKGRYMVIANGVLLESGPMPYGDGSEYPLIKFDDIKVSGSFWSIGTMENIIPIQKGYNRTISQIIENSNSMGNIKVMAPKGHGLHKEAWDDSGSEFIEYKPGFKPEQLDLSSLPAYVVNMLEVYDKNFEDVSGQHEVSQGKVPAGVKSGRAIIALQEQDDTRLAPTKMNFLRNMEQLGVMILKLYEEFQDEDRQYQIIGESAFDIDEITVTKEDIASMKKDVRVQTENLIAAHKRLQQEQVLEMYQAGMFGPQDDPKVRKKALELLEFGSVGELFDEMNVDTSQARKENEEFVAGDGEQMELMPDPKIPPNPATGQPSMAYTIRAFEFEDHHIHIAEHDKFRKSPRYRKMNQAQRRAIDHHVDQHVDFLNPKKSAPPIPGPGATPSPPPGGPIGAPPMPLNANPGTIPPVPPVDAGGGPVSAGVNPSAPASTPMVDGPDLGTG